MRERTIFRETEVNADPAITENASAKSLAAGDRVVFLGVIGVGVRRHLADEISTWCRNDMKALGMEPLPCGVVGGRC